MKKLISKVLIITLLFTTSSFNILSSVFTDMLSIKKSKYKTSNSSVLSHNAYAADFNYLTVTKTYKKYERSEACYFWYDYEGQGINNTLVTCNGVTWGSEHSRGGFKESEYTVIENYETYEDLFNALKETNNNYCFFDYQNQNMKEYNGRDFVDFPADNGWSWYFLYVALKDVTITGKSKLDNEILTDSYKNVLSVLSHNDEIYYIPYTTTADGSIMYSYQKEAINSSMFQQNITLNVNSDLNAINNYSSLFENSKVGNIKINDINFNTYNNLNIATRNEINIATTSVASQSVIEEKNNYYNGALEDLIDNVSMLSNMPLLSVSPYTSKLNEDPNPYEYLTIRLDKEEYRACYPFYQGPWSSGKDGYDYDSANELYVMKSDCRPSSTTCDGSPEHGTVTRSWSYYRNTNQVTKYKHFESWADVSTFLANLRNTAQMSVDQQCSNFSAGWYKGADYASYDVYTGITIYGKSKYLKETESTVLKKWCSLGGSGSCGSASFGYSSKVGGTRLLASYVSGGLTIYTGYSASSFDNRLEFIDIQADMSCLRSMEGIFEGCRAKAIYINDNGFDKITNMGKLFKNCSQLEKVAFVPFEAPICTDMSEMFSGCVNLTDVNLTTFDTHYVCDVHEMFKDCKKMENYNLVEFNTENIINMEGMFENNVLVNEIDLKSFVTPKLEKCKNMFKGSNNLIRVIVTDLFTIDNVVDNGENMFLGCLNIEGEKMTEYDSSVTDFKAAIIDKGGSTWGIDKGYFVCGHRLNVTSTISEPTCLTDGEYRRYCLGCYKTLDSQPIPALGHIATQSIINMPTCYSVGTVSEICKRCNVCLGYITLPKLLTHRMPHLEIVINDSSCTVLGIKEEYCPDCNIFIATTSIALKAHSFSSWYKNQRSCLVCGYIETQHFGSGGGSDGYSENVGPLADKTKINDSNILDGPLSPDLNAIQVNATYKNAPIFNQNTEKKDEEIEYIEEYEEIIEERSLFERLYDNTIGRLIHNKKERQKKENIEEENYYTYEMKNQNVLEKSIARVKDSINDLVG